MISSQLAILAQGKRYLTLISDTQYTEVRPSVFNSSAGTHMRHILDHYQALMQRQQGLINYNVRQRYSKTETSAQSALKLTEEIEHWLLQLDDNQLSEEVQVMSEMAIDNEKNALTTSTLARELLFVSSHAVHHYSIIKLICGLQDIQLPDNFGVAPATVTFERNQAS
jgi:uncharacterized damage-inducible protein DinB